MNLPADFLEQLKQHYPKRNGDQGWRRVKDLVQRAVASGDDWTRILQGAIHYGTHCANNDKVGTEYVKQAATFFGRDKWYEEWADMDVRTDAQRALDDKWADLDRRCTALGILLNRAQGYDYALQGVLSAEKQALNRKWEARGMNQPKFKVVS